MSGTEVFLYTDIHGSVALQKVTYSSLTSVTYNFKTKNDHTAAPNTRPISATVSEYELSIYNSFILHYPIVCCLWLANQESTA